MTKTIVLLTPVTGAPLERLEAIFRDRARVVVATCLADLEAFEFEAETTLLSFGSGVIVPGEFLSKLATPAYNLHAASPEFPGRDPHHHAIYRGAKTYGATLHIMTSLVDAGPIVGVEMFAVEPGDAPLDLLARANEAGMILLERHGTRLLASRSLAELDNVCWGKTKTTRADLTRLSEITPLIDEIEFERRYRSFDGGDHDNLALQLHGKTFRIDKKKPLPLRDRASFSGFTETAFSDLLHQLKDGGYRFARYGDGGEDRHVIWRHDVDISMHRAVRLAEIEAKSGVLATYFINPRCAFYNLMEPEIEALLHRIRDFGHEIGLHFDASAYDVRLWTGEALERALAREKLLLELILQKTVHAVSWHNPDCSNLLDFEAEEIGGLFNAYSARLKRDYIYCSDSNGYWRFKPMPEVIAQSHPRLHLLTHPAWWTPERMSSSQRIDRAILGRARKIRRDYDDQLVKGNRKDVSD